MWEQRQKGRAERSSLLPEHLPSFGPKFSSKVSCSNKSLRVLPSLTTSVTHEEFPTTRGLGPETTNSLFYFKDKEIPTKTISPSTMQRNSWAGRQDAQSSFRGGSGVLDLRAWGENDLRYYKFMAFQRVTVCKLKQNDSIRISWGKLLGKKQAPWWYSL